MRLAIVLLGIKIAFKHCITTLTLSLTKAALLVKAQFLFKHETRHLYTFKAIKGSVRLIFIESLLVICSLALMTWSRLVMEKNLVHLFFCNVEAVLNRLRTRRSSRWQRAITSILASLELLLVLGLLKDPK